MVCVESRQAYQALRSLAAHKTDRNDAQGLAYLARTGFFKPVHVKSLPSHAVRALIIARKKLVGQRVTLENQIRGLEWRSGSAQDAPVRNRQKMPFKNDRSSPRGLLGKGGSITDHSKCVRSKRGGSANLNSGLSGIVA